VVAPRLELDEADEIFITNALIGIWPLRQLGARVLRSPGTVTRQLMKTLRHPRMR
jgi:4-amino-4-deoxychorismate lyase